MISQEQEKIAFNEVLLANPGSSNFIVRNVYENIMDGILVEIGFKLEDGVWAMNHVLFSQDKISVYRTFHEVCIAFAACKEKSILFRLLNFTGVNGFIALILLTIFSILLSIMAISNTTPNPSVIEVIKLTFAIILGYFFGSQASRS